MPTTIGQRIATAALEPTATDDANAIIAAASVIAAAGVPAGAPGAGKLPIAFDTTVPAKPDAYYWDGAAWVKFSVGAVNFP